MRARARPADKRQRGLGKCGTPKHQRDGAKHNKDGSRESGRCYDSVLIGDCFGQESDDGRVLHQSVTKDCSRGSDGRELLMSRTGVGCVLNERVM